MSEVSLSRIVAHWAEIQPDKPAVDHHGEQLTWTQLEASSNQLARAYQAMGVSEGDFVTIALPNGVEFFQATVAVWKLGATPQPVSSRLPKFERDQIIELGKPSLVVGVEDGEYAPIPSIAAGYTPDPSLSDAPLPEKTSVSMKAMTSGGSTGRPKLIVSKTPAVWDLETEYLEIRTQGAMLVPGPLYHNGPFMWAIIAMFKGATVAVTTRFDAEQTLDIIEKLKIDTVYMVPTMMRRIWALPEDVRLKYDVSSLKSLWHLAAPCPRWLKEEFINWLGPEVIWELYGGTEGQGSTTIQGTEWINHVGSVGKPVETCEMKIVGDDGETLPPGELGEVFLRPLAGQGTSYYYLGAEPKAIEGGWESLGDMGWMDSDGYLYLTDRRSDMIVVGGANIYPAEIEAALDSFDGVRSSAVIGMPDEDMGALLHAIVDVPKGDLDENALRAHLVERLVKYKLPRTIEMVTEPLRDDAGKTRRKALLEARITAAKQV